MKYHSDFFPIFPKLVYFYLYASWDRSARQLSLRLLNSDFLKIDESRLVDVQHKARSIGTLRISTHCEQGIIETIIHCTALDI